MLKIITSLSMFLVGALAQSQVSETRKMENFSKVVVTDGAEVIVTFDSSPSLTAQAGDALSLNDLVTEVKNNTLYVYTKDALDTQAKVFLSLKDIEAVEVLNRSKMSVTNAVASTNFEITLSGHSIFTGDVNAKNMQLTLKSGSLYNGNIVSKKLTADLRGASVARLSGFANQAELSASSGSVCNAKRLYTDSTAIKATGNSNVMANADGDVNVDITQGSQASWAGYPETVTLPENTQIVSKPATAVSGL